MYALFFCMPSIRWWAMINCQTAMLGHQVETFYYCPVKLWKKLKCDKIRSAMSDDTVRKMPLRFFFSFGLFGWNRPCTPLSFLKKWNLPSRSCLCVITESPASQVSWQTLVFLDLHFQVIAVIFVNFTFSTLKKDDAVIIHFKVFNL